MQHRHWRFDGAFFGCFFPPISPRSSTFWRIIKDLEESSFGHSAEIWEYSFHSDFAHNPNSYYLKLSNRLHDTCNLSGTKILNFPHCCVWRKIWYQDARNVVMSFLSEKIMSSFSSLIITAGTDPKLFPPIPCLQMIPCPFGAFLWMIPPTPK